jgi:hypothetical protein
MSTSRLWVATINIISKKIYLIVKFILKKY